MTDDTQFRRLEATVQGRVQGVGFRYFVYEHAGRLGLTGFVRNQPSGEVEVVAEGPRRALEQLATHLQRGPAGAFVSGVQVDYLDATGGYARFEVRS